MIGQNCLISTGYLFTQATGNLERFPYDSAISRKETVFFGSRQNHVSPGQLPRLGIGLGLRDSIFEETKAACDQIDWLEVIPENYMGRGGRRLELIEQALDHGFTLVPHGINLSIGSIDPLNET